MNEQIEKMVEEFYEHNGDITSDWLRSSLTTAYNAGLERAKEVAKEKLPNILHEFQKEWNSGGFQDGRADPLERRAMKNMHTDTLLAAIEKEKLTDQA